jgi:trk system potassium uptake protein TrkA
VPRTIARLTNPKNEALFKKLGIDVAISSVNLILEHIEEEIPTHPLIHLLALRGGELEVVEVKIPPLSPMVGKRVGDLSLPPGSILSSIIRKDQEAQAPTADTVIQAGDRLIAVTKPELEESLRDALIAS